jgi:transposase
MSGKSQGQASAVSTPYTVHSVPFFLETFKTKKKKRKEKKRKEKKRKEKKRKEKKRTRKEQEKKRTRKEKNKKRKKSFVPKQNCLPMSMDFHHP